MAIRNGRANGRALTQDIGGTGLDAYHGYIREDFLTEWRGAKKIDVVTEMLYNSSVIAALRLAIEQSVLDIDWYFTGPEETDGGDPVLDFLNDQETFMTHTIKEHVLDASLYPFYGWSMMAIVYQRIGGRLYWRKFKALGHETLQRWLFADDGGLEGVQQYPHYWPAPIPIERMVLYRFRPYKNNPEGFSILRSAYLPYYYSKHLTEIEAIGIERNLAGLPMIRLPEGADTTDSDAETTDVGKAKAIVRRVRNDQEAGLVLPPGWEFELLGATGVSKVIDTNMVISRHDKRMLMSALAQFIMLGMDNIGALATFEGATDFFSLLTNSVADTVAQTFTKYPLERLLRLNGFDPTGYQLEHSPANTVDLTKLGDFLGKLSSFVTWTPTDERWLRSQTRMPELTVEQIEEAKEEARQKAREMASTLPFGRNGQNDQDNQGAELFAADNAPDDDERRRFERRWQRDMTIFFQGQKERVIKRAKADQ